ncbi:acyl-CoA thioesterase [Tengunoibacter tsumagoiensis]|uniref:4-hydroxybenzoyl-CoA thioesterase n=1 Tax=Tengunoibacter tsumagoiensis TaxID=2014871 RepID=A0A402A9H8_9CHLR|nr:acyl-CoA thioesterase [Tengunoibacter tsumagoiensis]GCE15779.1 4-hydroxybenzoyl-CoA thioesterase [Tengunoibacter tsumagoiensis]
MRTYTYHHIVGFEETNLVGNVYYVNHLKWQGRCREMFLHDHAPAILAQLEQGLALVTIRCACDYFLELVAFDHITISMRLGAIAQNRITLLFDYLRTTPTGEELIARGEQQVGCMLRDGESMRPTPIPGVLYEALKQFSEP